MSRVRSFIRWLDALWVSVFVYLIPIIPVLAIVREKLRNLPRSASADRMGGAQGEAAMSHPHPERGNESSDSLVPSSRLRKRRRETGSEPARTAA